MAWKFFTIQYFTEMSLKVLIFLNCLIQQLQEDKPDYQQRKCPFYKYIQGMVKLNLMFYAEILLKEKTNIIISFDILEEISIFAMIYAIDIEPFHHMEWKW